MAQASIIFPKLLEKSSLSYLLAPSVSISLSVCLFILFFPPRLIHLSPIQVIFNGFYLNSNWNEVERKNLKSNSNENAVVSEVFLLSTSSHAPFYRSGMFFDFSVLSKIPTYFINLNSIDILSLL